jgi:hypothetical protein
MLAVAAVLAAVAGGCMGSGVDRDAYVNDNREIFSELPRFPGSTVREEVSTAYRMEENEPIGGYGTRFVLELPAGAAVDELVSFFEEHIGSEWRLVETLDGPVLNYRRADASASINLVNWRVHQMEIAVDHAFYEKRGL